MKGIQEALPGHRLLLCPKPQEVDGDSTFDAHEDTLPKKILQRNSARNLGIKELEYPGIKCYCGRFPEKEKDLKYP